MYVAGDVCELDNEKYIAWQMVVRVQKINSNIQTLGDKIKQTNIFISPVENINKWAEVYSKVGRLFIKAQKKQVVWVAGVMREEGITMDKVTDLAIEKVRGGVTKKTVDNLKVCTSQILHHEDEFCIHFKQNLVESI